MRRAVSLTVAVGLAAGLSALGPTAAHAQDENYLGEFGYTITATQAQVNTYGGITVSGTMTCVDAVHRAEQAAVEAQGGDVTAQVETYGADHFVPAGVSYTVTQYVGKTKANSAQYNSGIAQPCYMADTPGPYPWLTRYPYPSGGPQLWLYSSTGKFTPGSVHVELISDSEITIDVFDDSGQQVHTYTADLYAFAGNNLKATSVKAR